MLHLIVVNHTLYLFMKSIDFQIFIYFFPSPCRSEKKDLLCIFRELSSFIKIRLHTILINNILYFKHFLILQSS